MTDIEFEILDELYFVKSIDELKSTFGNDQIDIINVVWNLIEKKWVKALDLSDNELEILKAEYLNNYNQFRFNITKKGLIAHNQI